MVPAPVGFHCPSCVAEARRAVPPTRTSVGAVASRHPRRATTVLIGVNTVVYAATVLSSDRLLVQYGLLGVAVADGEWWRLLTAPFLHGNLAHIGLNMLALWILGSAVEPALGRARFLTVYGLSALGGTTASYLVANPLVLSVGASGAVFGLLGALLVVLRRLNRDVSGVLVLLAVNLVLGFLVPNIDWRAHLGGLVVGVLVTAAFVYPPRAARAAVGWAVSAATLGALAWAAALRSDQILALLT